MSDWTSRLNLEVREGLDDPLSVIRGIVDESQGIESSLREWVRVARLKGHSWQEVAGALRVTRQSAWERFRDVAGTRGTESDPAFASAVEHAYLRELGGQTLESGADPMALHKELLASAIYAADRTNGGHRFKRLVEAPELETRLLRALRLRDR